MPARKAAARRKTSPKDSASRTKATGKESTSRRSASRRPTVKSTEAEQSALKRSASKRPSVKSPAAEQSASKRSASRQSASTRSRSRPPGTTRAANKEATQKRILKAALELFESKGFDNTTTSAIAKRANIAEGTVFNYFETKDDIVLYFLELEVDEAILAVRSRPKLKNAPLEEKLFALIERQLEYLAPYEKFIGAAFLQALRPASKLAVSLRALSLRQRYVAFVEQLMHESLPASGLNVYAWIAPQIFYLYYIGVLLFWLNDTSDKKQATLAFLDRSLAIGVSALQKGTLP